MKISRGKQIDSGRLKRNLDKKDSIIEASAFSQNIPKGSYIQKCPICQSSVAQDIVEIYGFFYRECLECGTVYVANPPLEKDIQAAYSSEYYTAVNKKLLANDQIIEYRVEQIAEPKVAFVKENLTTKKNTWLDVGCGVGEILSAAKRQGFEVLGLEANSMESKYARSTFGVEVRNEYVSETTLKNYTDQFGVISLFSVLEHVLSPNAILKDTSKIQSKGDNLVIEVPHYPSISIFSQITFPEQVNRMMHPPLHLFLFPLKALEKMLKVHCYKIVSAWFFGQDFYEMFSTLGLFDTRLNDSVLHNAVTPLFNDFQKVIDNHGLSDEILIVAEKVS
ncbi:MAG: methyltransferase domain-containing protein [Endozoicomonadaceae bacterium]|nr:methyltransferase domain-containing protein [Endozoicomonadaceae bacterium]